MDTKQVYQNVIGVDIAKRKLDLFQSNSKRLSKIANDAESIGQLVTEIKESRLKTLVVMEGTGGYERLLVDALLEHRIDCVVANPRQVRNFILGCGRIEKSDPIDAAHIAFFGEIVEQKPLEKRDENVTKLKNLVHRREQVIKQITQEKNRLGQAWDVDSKESIQQAVEFYTQQKKKLDKKIRKCLEQCKRLQEKIEIVASAKGVGPVTTAVLMAELPELGSLPRGQIAKLAGVAPMVNDSGASSRKRKTMGGRSLLRKALYMATLVATQCNERIQAFYQLLVAKGKPKKVALVACMRKLLTILNAMVKSGTKWGENLLAT